MKNSTIYEIGLRPGVADPGTGARTVLSASPSVTHHASIRAGCNHATALLCSLLLSPFSTSACDVPVFRYALDRWPADVFRLEAPATVLQTEPLATECRNLTGRDGLNLEAAVSTNQAKLFFPLHVRKAVGPAWAGELSPAVYAKLTDSPARQEIVQRILDGHSAVWLLVEGDDAKQNDDAATLLRNRLAFLESAVGLPRLDPSDPDSQLGPGPELKVKLALLRVKRNDPKEQEFLTLLAGPAGLKQFPIGQPFVSVVFGRGRVLGAWGRDRLDAEFIRETTLFLHGSCSCEVKSLNPGWDLLLRVDWDGELRKIGTARAIASGRKIPQPVQLKPETVVIRPN